MHSDITVIGGGVVGLSIAYGLLKKGLSVTCIDGSDSDFRASRGNFGLVWVQSKGIGHPAYAAWTQDAVRRYPDFVAQLQEESEIQISYEQTGGYEYFLDEHALEERFKQFSQLREELNGDYPFEIFDATRIRQEEPAVGNAVVGATFYPDDGHINPLQLLHALLVSCRKFGLSHLSNARVQSAERTHSGFNLKLDNGKNVTSRRVVLAAGLGAKKLGPLFGFKGLVRPQRGQVLVTEKLPHLLNRPSLTLRQVNEGGIQIGDSKEDVGFDDTETLSVISRIAERALKVMPCLRDVRLVRTWGALRVMSPDGLPIYQQSVSHPGASLITCHSGISLAASHASTLAEWILETPESPNLNYFSEHRF